MANSRKKSHDKELSPLGDGARTFAESLRHGTAEARREREKERAHTAENINHATIRPAVVAGGLAILLAMLMTAMFLHSRSTALTAREWTYPVQDPEQKFTIVNPQMPDYWLIITVAVLILAGVIFAIINGLNRHPRSRLSTIKHEFIAPVVTMIITVTSLIAYPVYAQDVMSQSDEARTQALVEWIDARYNYNFDPIPVDQLEQLLGNGETSSKGTNRIIVNGVIITALREGDQLIILTSDGTRELPRASDDADQAPPVDRE